MNLFATLFKVRKISLYVFFFTYMFLVTLISNFNTDITYTVELVFFQKVTLIKHKALVFSQSKYVKEYKDYYFFLKKLLK